MKLETIEAQYLDAFVRWLGYKAYSTQPHPNTLAVLSWIKNTQPCELQVTYCGVLGWLLKVGNENQSLAITEKNALWLIGYIKRSQGVYV